MRRLPSDMTTPEAMKASEDHNRVIFETIMQNAKSDEPIWKVKGFKNPITGKEDTKALEPSREEMMRRLPSDMTTPEAMKASEDHNRVIFETIMQNAKSDEPIWKVK